MPVPSISAIFRFSFRSSFQRQPAYCATRSAASTPDFWLSLSTALKQRQKTRQAQHRHLFLSLQLPFSTAVRKICLSTRCSSLLVHRWASTFQPRWPAKTFPLRWRPFCSHLVFGWLSLQTRWLDGSRSAPGMKSLLTSCPSFLAPLTISAPLTLLSVNWIWWIMLPCRHRARSTIGCETNLTSQWRSVTFSTRAVTGVKQQRGMLWVSSILSFLPPFAPHSPLSLSVSLSFTHSVSKLFSVKNMLILALELRKQAVVMETKMELMLLIESHSKNVVWCPNMVGERIWLGLEKPISTNVTFVQKELSSASFSCDYLNFFLLQAAGRLHFGLLRHSVRPGNAVQPSKMPRSSEDWTGVGQPVLRVCGHRSSRRQPSSISPVGETGHHTGVAEDHLRWLARFLPPSRAVLSADGPLLLPQKLHFQELSRQTTRGRHGGKLGWSSWSGGKHC